MDLEKHVGIFIVGGTDDQRVASASRFAEEYRIFSVPFNYLRDAVPDGDPCKWSWVSHAAYTEIGDKTSCDALAIATTELRILDTTKPMISEMGVVGAMRHAVARRRLLKSFYSIATRYRVEGAYKEPARIIYHTAPPEVQ